MRCDVAIIGAGPAGIAAAVQLADHRSVVVLDLAQRTGGQYYRHREQGGPIDPKYVLRREFCHSMGVRFQTGQQVFLVEPGPPFTVHAGQTVVADRLLIATGAYDRVVPFPGWDLPGVLTAGGAQSLWKGNGVLPGRRIVVAGTGPFLLPVAAGLAQAGATVSVHEANHPSRFLRFPRTVAGNTDKLREAAGYYTTLARRRVRVRHGERVQAAHGMDRIAAVTVGDRTIGCDILAVSHGFVPQIDIGVTLGCATHVTADGTHAITVDDNQATSVPGVYAAGEVTGIGGARLAEVEGAIAGRALADVPGLQVKTAWAERELARRRAFAHALAAVYPPPAPDITDDTIVCRCEEVSCRTIRAATTDLGAHDARTVKLLTRAGMGWCQGRMCGATIATLLGAPPDLPRRILTQPARLTDLANLADSTEQPTEQTRQRSAQRPEEST